MLTHGMKRHGWIFGRKRRESCNEQEQGLMAGSLAKTRDISTIGNSLHVQIVFVVTIRGVDSHWVGIHCNSRELRMHQGL
jgi:hypothetical protein